MFVSGQFFRSEPLIIPGWQKRVGFAVIFQGEAMKGWLEFSRKFPERKKQFYVDSRSFVPVNFLSVGNLDSLSYEKYQGCKFLFSETGLTIKPFFIFRIFFRSIYIPWDRFQVVRRRSGFLSLSVVEIKGTGVGFGLLSGHFKLVEKYLES